MKDSHDLNLGKLEREIGLLLFLIWKQEKEGGKFDRELAEQIQRVHNLTSPLRSK